MKDVPFWLFLLALLLFCGGCEAWTVDYGKPAAQFHAADVLEKGKSYQGKKITVKGVVTRQDLSDPENCRIYLSDSICCNLGKLKKMAEGYRVGKTVLIDGLLKRCDPGDILLEPAIGRDPKTEFQPIE